MGMSDTLKKDWDRLMRLSHSEAKFRFYKIFNPRFFPVFLIRLAFFCQRYRLTILAKLISLFNFVFFGMEVPVGLKIGPGLVITHTNGIVLGANEIGNNVTLFHQVTLGALVADFHNDLRTRPKVDDGVTIYCGAKIFGSITLGENCVVGANAVVLKDVRGGATVIGIPAKEAR
jgi:serine O-acetyltransferase